MAFWDVRPCNLANSVQAHGDIYISVKDAQCFLSAIILSEASVSVARKYYLFPAKHIFRR